MRMLLRRVSRRRILPLLHLRSFSVASTLLNPSSDSGSHARTNPDLTIPLPPESSLPSSRPVRRYKPTLSSFSLEGKTVVVTGGARGLGYVMTQALVESGADVAILDLDHDEAQKSARTLTDHFVELHPDTAPPLITAHRADVSDDRNVRDTFRQVLGEHQGKVDVLVTSAGFTENYRAEEYPPDRLQRLWEVNVNGTYFCACEVARHLIARKAPGSLIFIGSMSGSVVNVPQPQAPYNASKAAVRQLAASFAVEWARYGIRVNTIAPGYMVTALTKKILAEKPELREKWTSLTPTGRLGEPEDLMGAVVYLASGASAYVTGSELRVDGGYTVT